MQDALLRKKIFLTEFFGEFIPIYALIPLLFIEYGNMNALQVGTLLALWQILIVIFEVPTGVVADRYGRKLSMQLGKLMRVVSFPIWLLFPGFIGLTVGIVFLALGDALLSGSLEAYSYDELSDKKKFNKLRQQTMSVHLAAFTAAGFASYLLGADFKQILIASIVMSAIGFATSFLLPRDVQHQPEITSIRSILKTSHIELNKSPTVLVVFLRAALILALMITFIEQINLFYSNTGISTKTVSLLMAIGNLITFVILWTSHLYERWTRKYQIILLSFFMIALTAATYITQNAALQISLIFIFVRFTRLANVNMSNDLHHAVSSSARATIGSLASFMAKILAALSMLLIGFASQSNSDIKKPLTIAGLLLLSLLVATYAHKKTKNK